MGFQVREVIGTSPDEVWSYLTDWERASEWMGVDGVRAAGTGVGTRICFVSRGADRESEIGVQHRVRRCVQHRSRSRRAP